MFNSVTAGDVVGPWGPVRLGGEAVRGGLGALCQGSREMGLNWGVRSSSFLRSEKS